MRKSGEPYFIHPFEVAKILAKTRLDANTIIAGFLHDVIEDTEIGADEIENKFGEDVKNIVLGVTKISTLDARKKESEAAENLIKMFLAAVEWDIRIILVKLADRLHNMRTLKYLPRDRRKKIARETIDIIAPLAQRLGISKVQRELEDLSLKYLKPEVYREIYLKMHYILKSQGEFFKEIEDTLNKELIKHGIKASIRGRVKNIYSIYNKMIKKEKEISEIYDIVALRIITEGNEIQNCYAVLGIVHSLWTPILNRVKDYIASPKPNFYRSLHTTVVGPKGNPLEIQIRTQDMHEIAEYGIAAHWLYKSGKRIDRSKFKDVKNISILREIVALLEENKDPFKALSEIKQDLLTEEVYVFTPKGDVISLPMGSTSIDFAYRIHTEIGHTCIGAKVNGIMVPLSYKLKTGDVVSILTSKKAKPSTDWLKFVKSAHAKNKIKSWMRKQLKDESIKIGKEMLEKEVKRYGLNVAEVLKMNNLKKACEEFSINDVDTLLAMVKQGDLSPVNVLEKIIPKEEESFWRERIATPVTEWGKITRVENGKAIQVKGVDNVLVRLAPCCNPIPGEPIIGYITRGKGITVHRLTCPNIVNLKETEKERLIEVKWAQDVNLSYPIMLKIEALDRVNLLAEVMEVFSNKRISATSVNVTTNSGLAYIDVSFMVENVGRLKEIIINLKRVKGVLKIYRIKNMKIN